MDLKGLKELILSIPEPWNTIFIEPGKAEAILIRVPEGVNHEDVTKQIGRVTKTVGLKVPILCLPHDFEIYTVEGGIEDDNDSKN